MRECLALEESVLPKYERKTAATRVQPHHAHIEASLAADAGRLGPRRPFEIALGRSGRVIQVAAGQGAAEPLPDAGFDISLSCEQRVCCTCSPKLPAGLRDHRDIYFTPAEHARNDCVRAAAGPRPCPRSGTLHRRRRQRPHGAAGLESGT